MYVVAGANGNTGRVTAQRLLDAGKKVRLIVRDPKKVESFAARGAEVVVGSRGRECSGERSAARRVLT